MSNRIYASPAYGRSYKTIDDLRKDWEGGKDFRLWCPGISGTYFSIRDFEDFESDEVESISFVLYSSAKNQKLYQYDLVDRGRGIGWIE